MHPEIAALAARRGLDSSVAREFAMLFDHLTTATHTFGDTEIDLVSDSGDVRPASTDSPFEPIPEVPDRYEDLGLLGVGGMGEVRRVRDRDLGRICALKVVKRELGGRTALMSRFIEEAQVAAQLQHPNIAPIYDLGRLADGRPWFTMKEVRGSTLTEHIDAAHDRGLESASLRRLVDAFASVCDGVGYAHSRGVLHRDLKPDNVMLGTHGEVLVLDWGLSKVAQLPADPGASAAHPRRTAAGHVLGTPSYMAPEQARAEPLDARADVYALGAMLYEVLTGEPPYVGPDAQTVLRQLLSGPPVPIETRGRSDLPLPDELIAIANACLHRDRLQRPPSGAAVAAEVRAWLDGARRRERALEIVHEADALDATIRHRVSEQNRLESEGAAVLAGVPAWADEAQKIPGWTLLDAAESARRGARALELQRDALLRGALSHAPDLPEAHERLLDVEITRHRRAEAERDLGAAERSAQLIGEHCAALAPTNPHVVRARASMRGEGRLTLHTDRHGARIDVFRFEEAHRRLIPRVFASWTDAIEDAPIGIGSYVAHISHPDSAPVHVPFVIERNATWSPTDPDGSPIPVRLPARGAIAHDERVVPAGWYRSGGDPNAIDSLPSRRLWVGDLVFKRFPVTNREYVRFLDDLVAHGRSGEAERFQPRERSASDGAPVYGRTAEGGFRLQADDDGDVWDPEFPVMLVDWFAARAYAEWLATRTGQPWRLPGEFEWEKAARGVDGRFFPWGDTCDPSWCCLRASRPGRPLPSRIDSFPVDTSVYDVRGFGGNVQEWCVDAFSRVGPLTDSSGRLTVIEAVDAGPRPFRGGYWYGTARNARCAVRSGDDPTYRNVVLGFRVVRPL